MKLAGPYGKESDGILSTYEASISQEVCSSFAEIVSPARKYGCVPESLVGASVFRLKPDIRGGSTLGLLFSPIVLLCEMATIHILVDGGSTE